jgi:hypothetical protein
MIQFFQIFFSLLVLIVIAPQTEQYNIVLNFLHKTEFFVDYKEVKIFLRIFSWSLIILFLIFSLF